MIQDKDKLVKERLYVTLLQLGLQEPRTEADYLPYIGNLGGVQLASSRFDIEFHKHLLVDSEGNVCLSDRDIDKIAQRVYDLIASKGIKNE